MTDTIIARTQNFLCLDSLDISASQSPYPFLELRTHPPCFQYRRMIPVSIQQTCNHSGTHQCPACYIHTTHSTPKTTSQCHQKVFISTFLVPTLLQFICKGQKHCLTAIATKPVFPFNSQITSFHIEKISYFCKGNDLFAIFRKIFNTIRQ